MANPPILLLDIMGTVVREPFLVDIPAFFGRSRHELYPLLSRDAWFAFERGEIDRATFGARFFRDGRPLDLDGLSSLQHRCRRHEARGIILDRQSKADCSRLSRKDRDDRR